MSELEPISTDATAAFLAQVRTQPFEGGICAGCGGVFAGLEASAAAPRYCHDCQCRAGEQASIERDLDAHVEATLVGAGVERRELVARLERIPAEVATRLPQGPVTELLAGSVPARGFGICGPHDRGKTMAIAAILAEHVRQRIHRRAASVGAKALMPWMVWLNWPDQVNQLRVIAMEDRGAKEVDRRIRAAVNAEVLVLDDLGAERIRGEFHEDATASKLELIVDARNRALQPIFFTSNFSGAALIGLYGTRLTRRLLEAAESVVVP